jgi:ribosomal protein S18 acetylase RimI-like enzyme
VADRPALRRALPGDANAIARVQERGWQHAYRHVFPIEELDRGGFIKAELWRQRLATPPPTWSTFVAERDGAVVGFACVGASRDERGLGEVYAIYVDPDAWSSGVGRALLARAEEALAGAYEEATLWVLEDNPRARTFYERLGWRADGSRKREARWGVAAPELRYRKRVRA